VSAATRLQIGAIDLNRAQDSSALHFLAHTHHRKLLLRAVTHIDRPIFENDAIRGALRTFQNFEGRLGAAQIDRTQLRAEMKRNRLAAESLLKHG